MSRRLPRVLINLTKIAANCQSLNQRCRATGIGMTAVVKAVAGDERVMAALVDSGVTEIGDSRLENLAKLTKYNGIRRILLRLPAISQIEQVPQVADCSLNSETSTLQLLDRASAIAPHQIMLMVDQGDLREGVREERVAELGTFCRSLNYIRVIGLGTNFSCFAGAIPTSAKLERLVKLAGIFGDELGVELGCVSGGNSSSLPLLYQGCLPQGVNHLRLGEAVLLGRETLNGTYLPDLHQDAFLIQAEVVQSQLKAARPTEPTGLNAFGRRPDPVQAEAGPRMLLNIGHQDTPLDGLRPIDPDLTVLGGSSDYLVLAGSRLLPVGTVITFKPNYWSVLAAMTSPYVSKEYLS